MENLKMRGLEEDDSGIELELSLGIGGSFKRAGKTLEEPIIINDIPTYSEQQQQPPFLIPPFHESSFSSFSSGENLSFSDPESKRKIHAQRRQEAKKRLEEKQKKKKGKGKRGLEEEGDYKKKRIESGSGNHEEMKNVSLDSKRPLEMPGFRCGCVERASVNWRDFEKRETASLNGSPIRNSSDLPNSSSFPQGGSSTESGRYSTQTKSEPSCINGSGNMMAQSNYSVISHQIESTSKKIKPNSESQSNSKNSTITKIALAMTETIVEMDKPTNGEMSKPLKASEMGKPPADNLPYALPHILSVTTTGSGPNGIKVNGLLYRYTTLSEVNIVCICHGSSFSPAEFVRHAGGVDVTHPLRHITVLFN